MKIIFLVALGITCILGVGAYASQFDFNTKLIIASISTLSTIYGWTMAQLFYIWKKERRKKE